MSADPSVDPTYSSAPSRRPQTPLPLSQRIGMFPLAHSLIGVTLLAFGLQWISTALLGFDLVLALGAKDNLSLEQGQLWRLVTPLFIHGSLIHIGVNMYSLYVIGPVIERFFGWALMLSLYLLAGIAGAIASWFFNPYVSVGASGAIFGLLGALGAFLLVNRETFGAAGRLQFRQILMVALLNLILGLSPGIDNWGHLGGLVFGALVAWFVSPKFQLERFAPDEPPKITNLRSSAQARRAIVAAAVFLVLLTILGLN